MPDSTLIAPSFALSGAEEAVLAHLSEARPALAPAFLAHLTEGRRSIAHRLLQALVRERLIAPERVRLVGPLRLEIALAGPARLEAALERRLSLGRFDLAGAIRHRTPHGTVVVEGPEQLLDLCRPILGMACDDGRYARFRDELENSAANHALALVGAAERGAALLVEARALGVDDALSFAGVRQAQDPTFSPLAFFEQWVVDGHPLHPGAKIKMGLTPAEVVAHSPEWGATPRVRLVAIEKASCRVTTARGAMPAELLASEWPDQIRAARRELEARGLDPAGYALLPVHPWQFEHALGAHYPEALASGEIVPLAAPGLPTRALMAFRSLAPVQRQGEGKHHLKTSVDVQLTGAVRIITPQSVHNGPALSALLGRIQAREGGFGGRLVVLEEAAGICYQSPDPGLSEEARLAKSKHLAALFRENPENHAGPGELALAGACLIARSPLSARPLVVEAVEALARTEGLRDRGEAAVAFVRRHAEVALPGLLTLMTRYGVSLEGHLQNAVVILRGGMPVRMVVRDFGGVRVLLERLERTGLTVAFHPGSATLARDAEELRNKLIYSVLQNQMGELIATLHRALGLREAALWAPVAHVCRGVYAVLGQDPAIAAQAAADEAALFAPTVALKAMATMRLTGEVTRYSFAPVPNPLVGHEVTP